MFRQVFFVLLVIFSGGLAGNTLHAVHADMAPPMADPVRGAAEREAAVAVRDGEIVLENAQLQAVFTVGNDRLALTRLFNEYLDDDMLKQGAVSPIFVVESNDTRYYGNKDFAVREVTAVENGARLRLENSALPMAVTLDLSIDEEGMHIRADFKNTGGKALDFKVAVPVIGGLQLADEPELDYYYFPLGGGIIDTRAAVMRFGYGDSQALWQLVDIFAPGKGCGVYLRGDDSEGFHKNINLRKEIAGETARNTDAYMRTVTRPEYTWSSNALPEVPGSSFGLEYFRRTRKPGESYAPPAAVIGVHTGDWKTAMRRYSDWAHRVWQWRPFPSALSDKFMIGINGWPDNPLYGKDGYQKNFWQPHMDAVELTSWWEWSELGPFGVPFDQLDAQTYAGVKDYLVDDPVTGKKIFMGCGSDYARYNDRFGGIAALRAAIAANKQPGRLVTLYSDPFRLGENNETAKQFGDRWNFVSLDGKKTHYGETINPCHYLPAVQDWAVDALARVMRDTGADGLRLDEVGHPYGACFSLEHRHFPFEERGLAEWNKALGMMVRRLRAQMDQDNPQQVLMCEHQGYDYLMASLDGMLCYDLSLMDSWGTPQPETLRNGLEVNVQRFFFPECKVFEINLYGRDANHRKKFWNGVGSFHHTLPNNFLHIFKQNADVYTSVDCEPLVRSLATGIYVNRFSANGKSFYHLYNNSGAEFQGPALAVALGGYSPNLATMLEAPDHAFDMLNNREAVLENGKLNLTLAPDDVACIAIFPKVAEVEKDAAGIKVRAAAMPGLSAALSGADGGILAELPLVDGEADFNAGQLDGAVAVKLFNSNGILVDIVETK